MERLSLASHTLFADLLQRALDANFSTQFPENGSFSQMKRNDRAYWYYLGYQSGKSGGAEKKYTKYVGPVDDLEITKRVEEFRQIKDSYRERRRLVSVLLGMGLLRPDPFTGDLIEVLWKAGLFRPRAVLVGTVAFQTYAGLLGVRLPATQAMTSDLDIAQFHSISLLVGDTIPPILETLQSFDASFWEIAHPTDSRLSTAFANKHGFRLEFVTPNTSKDEYADKPADIPALSGASAQSLRFMDYLIHDPVHSVVLHKGGIAVLVPAPERHAVHKLIVSADRRTEGASAIKARKDAEQAGLLFEALEANSQKLDVGFAWMDAWSRGSGWQRPMLKGKERLEKLNSAHADLLREAVIAACLEEKEDPSAFGFDASRRSP
jgi:hypothetical protein